MHAVIEVTHAHTVCSDFGRKPGGELRPSRTCLRVVLKEDALKGSPSSMLHTQASLGLTFLILRVKPSSLPHEDLARSMRGHGALSCIHTHGLFVSFPTFPHPQHLPNRAGLGTASRQQVPPFTAVQKSLSGTDL